MAETASIVYSAFPFIAAIVLLAVIISHVVMVWKREKHVYPGDILWPLPFVVALLFVGCFCLKGWVLFEVGPIELCLFSVAMCVFGAITQIRRYFLTSLASLPRFTGWGVRALIACVAIAFVSVVSARMIDVDLQ